VAFQKKRFKRKRRVCVFCEEKQNTMNYKDVLPRRITGNCAKHQRAVTIAIKQSRHVSLMPYTLD